MILPMHELQLLDNQWHCAYCFMDVKMERMDVERMRQHQEAREAESEKSSRTDAHEKDSYHYRRPHAKEDEFGSAELHGEEGEGTEGNVEGAEGRGIAHKIPLGIGRRTCDSCSRSVSHGYYEGNGRFVCGFCHAQEFKTGHGGFCVKCSREFPSLYIFKGEQLCLECFAEASNIEATSWLGKLKLTFSRALKVVQRPKREVLNRKFSEEFRLAQEKKRREERKAGPKGSGAKGGSAKDDGRRS